MTVFNGSNIAETLTGGIGDDVLNALDGADTLDGGIGGIDTLNGGTGNDILYTRTDDEAYGGDGDDLIAVSGDVPAVLDGGLGNDTLRFDSAYDISGSILTGIESLFVYGTATMTAAQLGSFSLVSGYASNYTQAYVALSTGGAATVTLSATLTSLFQLSGSTQADNITFNLAHLYAINAWMGGGNDRVNAGAGNDSLRGDEGNDTLIGNDGDDSLDGSDGNDLLTAGAGNDYLVVRAGDSATGAAGSDVFSVYDAQFAVIDGGTDNDVLRFEGSYDISGATITNIEQANLYGNDSMTAAQMDAFTVLSGYAAGYTSATVFLTQGGIASVSLSANLSAYFYLYGSGDADLITFDPAYLAPINAFMGSGDDRISGATGNDSLRGDDGNDRLFGLLGDDSLDGGVGRDTLDGGTGNDYLIARAFDTVLGGGNDDLISVSESLPAVLNGGANLDTLRFEGSFDISNTVITSVEQAFLYGNDSMTAVQLESFALISGYATGYTSATVILTQGGTASVNLSSSLSASFNLYCSTTADTISFNAAYLGILNVFAGNGNDSITGATGSDSLRGDAGNDSLLGMNGNDYLDGGSQVDLIDGGNGDDTLVVRLGDSAFGGNNDDLFAVYESLPAVLNGGLGRDTLRIENYIDITGATITGIEILAIYYQISMTAAQLGSFNIVTGYSPGYTSAFLRLTEGGTVAINLDSTLSAGFSLNGSGTADIVTFNFNYRGNLTVNADFGADSITGALGNDILRGQGGLDTLIGSDGNDTIEGGSGADIMNGGGGIDLLTGGSGRDIFTFGGITSSTPATPDRIVDFEAAGAGKGDTINLVGIDADGGLGANDAFVFNSVGLGGVSIVDSGTDTLVRMNIDNDATFEIVILIADGAVLASAYTVADFNL